MRKILTLILVLLMFVPIVVSAETLTTTDVYTKIYDNGRHYDISFQIASGTDIGGYLDIYIEGTCRMYILTYEQFLLYNYTTIEVPAVGTYSYMVEAYYIDEAIYWNYTIPIDNPEWFFMFYKLGGSGGGMTINASIWDWSYVAIPTTTTYPTITEITHTSTNTITNTYSTITYPTETGETIPGPFRFDPYLIGMMVIVGIGFIGAIYVTGARSKWRIT